MIQPTNAYPQGGANAVAINIYNPQAYGSTGTTNSGTTQNVPYNYTNSLYQMPQTSNWQQNAIQPNAYQQYMPMQNPMMMPQAQNPMMMPQMQNPMMMPQAQNPMMMPQMQNPMMMPQAQAQPINQQIVAPLPQMMPQSVMEQPQLEQAQLQQQQAEAQNIQELPSQPDQVQQQEQPQAEVQQEQQTQPQVEIQQEQAPQAEQIDTGALIQDLQSQDSDKKAEAINKIAGYAQDEPGLALQMVSEPIMNSLVNVIKEDTTGLEGPTDAQIAVAEKITKGEKLTPEEETLSEQLSPRDKENKNRIFALYTLAMIQKLQRAELNDYIETQKANGEQPIDSLKIQDLVGYNDVVNVIQNDQRPEVKVAAIQALEHVAEPSDAQTVQEVLTNALNSDDEAVKAAANEALSSVQAQQAPQDQAQAQAQAQAPQDQAQAQAPQEQQKAA